MELIVTGYGETESRSDFKRELDKQVEEKYIETCHRWRHRKFLNHRLLVGKVESLSLPILLAFPLFICCWPLSKGLWTSGVPGFVFIYWNILFEPNVSCWFCVTRRAYSELVEVKYYTVLQGLKCLARSWYQFSSVLTKYQLMASWCVNMPKV